MLAPSPGPRLTDFPARPPVGRFGADDVQQIDDHPVGDETLAVGRRLEAFSSTLDVRETE